MPPRIARTRFRLPALALATALVAACGAPGARPPISPGTSDAPREVNLIAKEWTFVPPVVELVPGEMVLLHVVNGGTEPHEAVIGPAPVQDAWSRAHASAAGAPPGPTPRVSVPADTGGLRVFVRSGERVDALWTVPTSGELLVGCHIPGHYAQGMVVPVRFVEPGTVPGGV